MPHGRKGHWPTCRGSYAAVNVSLISFVPPCLEARKGGLTSCKVNRGSEELGSRTFMRSRGVRCQGARREPVLGACWTAGRGTRTAASCLCCCSATAPPVPAGGSSLGCNSPRMRPPSNFSALHFAVRRIPPCHRRCFTMHAYSVSGPTKLQAPVRLGLKKGVFAADKMLGPSLQLPGSLLGSLYALSQPLLRRGSSQEAAAAELQEAVESSDKGLSSMHAHFVAEMGCLGGGSLLLRQGPLR